MYQRNPRLEFSV